MENKKYADEKSLQAFVDNSKNLFATRTDVDDLSTNVAYINAEDNETITDVETEASGGSMGGGTHGNCIHIGTDAPTDGSTVWIDTDEDDANTGSSAFNDIVAAVGQTFRVKSVDENGKVTAVEAADYQEKICETKTEVILRETSIEMMLMDSDDDGEGDMPVGMLPEDLVLEGGKEYVISYNGVEYNCRSVVMSDDEYSTTFALGNIGIVTGGESPGEPFLMQVIIPKTEDATVENMILALDGSTEITLSIEQREYTPIPAGCVTNAMPYYIDVTGSGTDDDPFVCDDTVANVRGKYNSGRQLILRVFQPEFEDNNDVTFHVPLALVGETNYNGTVTTTYYFVGFGIADIRNIRLMLIPQTDGTFIVSDPTD